MNKLNKYKKNLTDLINDPRSHITEIQKNASFIEGAVFLAPPNYCYNIYITAGRLNPVNVPTEWMTIKRLERRVDDLLEENVNLRKKLKKRKK